MNKQIVPTVAAVLIVLAGIWLLSTRTRPMPDVVFNLVDGRTLDSAELRGKSLLINFWSVTCATCLRDLPVLNRLHETLQDSDFLVIGVAAPYDAPPDVIGMVETLKPVYPIALDVRGEISEAFGGIRVTPTNVLIDPRGEISSLQRGPVDEPRVRATLLTFQR